MALSHAPATRQAAGDAVVDLIDTGTGSPQRGKLVFATSASPGVAVATLRFANPAFGATNTSGVATANTITSDINAAGGTVAQFKILKSSNELVLGGAVSTSGSDINLSSLTVGAGDTVSVSSLTYTAPV